MAFNCWQTYCSVRAPLNSTKRSFPSVIDFEHTYPDLLWRKPGIFFSFFEYPLYAAYLGIIRERQSVYDSCHSTKCVRILGAWLDASDANTWWNPDVILRLAKSSNDKYNDYAQRYFWFVLVKWKLLLAIWVKLVYNYFK